MAIKNKIIAFSLIELVVGITISVLLMVSIGVFVTSGMQNIFLSQKNIQNVYDINSFSTNIYTNTKYIDIDDIMFGDDFLVFKRDKEYNLGGYSYLGIQELDKFFCDDSLSESTKTKHIFIKTFIPFLEEGKSLKDIENIYSSEYIDFDGKKVRSLQKENKIIDDKGEILLGKGIFGNELEEGGSLSKVYLNSPTGITVEKNDNKEILYISDTLNDRIIYIIDNKAFTLLDEQDGLNEPTGLYYDKKEKAIYISNSGNGEILKFSSREKISPKNLRIPIKGFEEKNVNKIEMEFILDGETFDISSKNFELESPISSFDYDDYTINKNGNKIIVESFKKKVLIPQEEEGEEDKFEDKDIYLNFEKDIEYDFNLNNLSTNFFDTPGNYFLKVKIGKTIKQFYIFTQSDNFVYTKNDNTLEVLSYKNLNYPTGLWKDDSGKLYYNDFKASDIQEFLILDNERDTILEVPVASLNISKDSNLINIIYKVYKSYNCYNLDENNKKLETFVSKINLKK